MMKGPINKADITILNIDELIRDLKFMRQKLLKLSEK